MSIHTSPIHYSAFVSFKKISKAKATLLLGAQMKLDLCLPLNCAMAKDSLKPSTSTSGTLTKRLRCMYPIFPSLPLLPKPEPRTVWQVRLLRCSLGFPGAVNINKVILGTWAKLRFSLAQAIPGGSWLQRVCTEQSLVFSSFVQALHLDSSM
jgi:hypothetical protein